MTTEQAVPSIALTLISCRHAMPYIPENYLSAEGQFIVELATGELVAAELWAGNPVDGDDQRWDTRGTGRHWVMAGKSHFDACNRLTNVVRWASLENVRADSPSDELVSVREVWAAMANHNILPSKDELFAVLTMFDELGEDVGVDLSLMRSPLSQADLARLYSATYQDEGHVKVSIEHPCTELIQRCLLELMVWRKSATPERLEAAKQLADEIDTVTADRGRAGSIYYEGFDAEGKLACRGSRSTPDVHRDMRIMTTILDFDYAAKRGTPINTVLGNLQLTNSMQASVDEPHASELKEAALAYQEARDRNTSHHNAMLQAIRVFRDKSGLSLIESKHACERAWAKGGFKK